MTTYTTGPGDPLWLAHDDLAELRLLADERSRPGIPVSVSDLVNEAVGAYLAGQQANLAEIAELAEAEELARVEATRGRAA